MTSRSNKEKMLAGERYNCLDLDLIAERERVQDLTRRFNQAAAASDRYALLRALIGQIGPSALIEPPFSCTYGQHIALGEHVYLNSGCTILDNNRVSIGDHTMIGPAVQIYTAAHPLAAAPRIQGWETALPIVIGENVWIGGGAIILPGVRIGDGAVIGAGAVVTHDVAANMLAVGNPARVIKAIDQERWEAEEPVR